MNNMSPSHEVRLQFNVIIIFLIIWTEYTVLMCYHSKNVLFKIYCLLTSLLNNNVLYTNYKNMFFNIHIFMEINICIIYYLQ